jgi:7-cyano-7-deazaguanine synthase
MKDTGKAHGLVKKSWNKKPYLICMKKAIVLLSGGLDSSVTAYIAKNKDYELSALSFLYGQQHDKEIQSAKNIARSLSIADHVFFELDLAQFGGSSLLKNSNKTISTPTDVSSIGNQIPETYVPGRNTIFLSIALAFAETRDAEAIFTGVTAMDYSGYPDCRPEFIEAFQRLADLATKKTVSGNSIQIETPLITLTKSEIITKGNQLHVPFELTWSCYNGRKKACGQCESCQLRLQGFQQAHLKDPLEYEQIPDWYHP